MSAADPIQIALRVAAAMEALGLAYHLGGSLASSIYGEPRATNDIDIVVELPIDKVGALIEALGPEFAIDRDSLTEAAKTRGSCNVFYLPLFTKVDVFVGSRDLFERAEMRRRTRVVVGASGEALFVKSAEDMVLRKLRWFRDGGETSERQWRDVVQVLRVSRGAIDDRVLDEWASALGIADLLAKARAAASRDDIPPDS
ncbi:MAG: hypothetical protein U0326_22725 [Polyangiales bacterium]